MNYFDILHEAQAYITTNYTAALTSPKDGQLTAYLDKFLRDKEPHIAENERKTLVQQLYREMAQYSVLTPYLENPDLEEININGYDDIALHYRDGTKVKAKEHFQSPQHAEDIIKRLLHRSGMVLDNAVPVAEGFLPNNTRISCVKPPVADADRGTASSIRILRPHIFTKNELIHTDFCTTEMMDFLSACLRYGVSMVIAGRTGSGKTTLENALLGTVPNQKRIVTIENGSRELSLIRREHGRVVNNVVHLLSRPSENPQQNISQDKLVVLSLRLNPDVICVGEMRDVEAYNAVEASLTGHTLITTVHAGSCTGTYTRVALLCQKRFPIAFDLSMLQAAQAFPIAVFTHTLEDNTRKIMEIAECEVTEAGQRVYHTLFRYAIRESVLQQDGTYRITGRFERVNPISESLKNRMVQNGMPRGLVQKIS